MTQERNTDTRSKVAWKGDVSDDIFTIPNIISFARLLMVPAFFVLLIKGFDIQATLLFSFAALTDWIDGYIARSTNSVSKLGRILDPAVDRLLMIFAVIGLMIIGRLPAWIMVLVLCRDLVMLVGYYVMLKRFKVRVDVILAGKIATSLLYIGFVGLLINAPLFMGFSLCSYLWLPGFNGQLVSWGIWFVYTGILLGIFTTGYYAIIGLLACQEVAEDLAETKK